ncbi:unnamed protein product [Effrenium voratum]|uniref:Uncharacterized protein n=1 Tax=Effrenium voratum TaxID=2562239 RepID=A0AA36I2L0_9DINO|nr:unnamed protein product [Effrenium voratum]
MKFKHGSAFRMKKVVLNSKVQPTYISADLKMTVDLQKTQMTANMCVSRLSVKDVLSISSRMAFDLTAVVRTVSSAKTAQLRSGQASEVVEVVMADGSKGDDGSLLCLTVSVWSRLRRGAWCLRRLDSCAGEQRRLHVHSAGTWTLCYLQMRQLHPWVALCPVSCLLTSPRTLRC